jgi:hypothetical protein
MNIQLILDSVEGVLITAKNLELLEVETAFTSDLMSDVLTVEVNKTLLITGLSNLQTIRTAEMCDIECIIIARNKRVTHDMIELAEKSKIRLIGSPFSVFRIAGILYQKGIKPLY